MAHSTSSDFCPVRTFIIIDDNEIFQRGFEWVCSRQSLWHLLGSTSQCHNGLLLIGEHRPAAVVINANMERQQGYVLIQNIRQHYPWVKILAFSALAVPFAENRCRNAGAHGFLSNSGDANSVFESLNRLMEQGADFGDVAPFETPSQERPRGAISGNRNPLTLTKAEKIVFDKIGEGLTTAQVAKAIFRSIKTVESHRSSIARKLGLTTGREVYRAAFYKILTDSRPLHTAPSS